MYRLEVLGREVCIAACHLKGSVPQHLLQMEDGPATPEVLDSKSVPRGVDRPPRRFKAKGAAELFYVA